MRITAAALLAMASCGGTSSEAAAPPPGPRFDVAIAVPRTAHLVWVPQASVRPWRGRELASTIRTCAGDGPAPWDVVRHEATCGALRLDGDRVIVPFAMPARGTELVIDRARLLVVPLESKRGVVRERPTIAVSIDAEHYEAEMRVDVGVRAFDCAGKADDRAAAQGLLDLCASLRTP